VRLFGEFGSNSTCCTMEKCHGQSKTLQTIRKNIQIDCKGNMLSLIFAHLFCTILIVSIIAITIAIYIARGLSLVS
jgi:hypothetical protein